MQLAFARVRRRPKVRSLWPFIFAPLLAFGQTNDTSFLVRGFVLAANDSSSIEAAHVYQRNTTLGTVTNSSGEFAISLPITSAKDELIISAIGYQTGIIGIEQASTVGTVYVYLVPSIFLLDEVLVTTSKVDSARLILGEAVHAIRFNFPRKVHKMDGFYRALSTVDTVYTRLIESAIRVQEVGYNKDTWEDESLSMVRNRIQVLELRKSDDLRDKDLFSKALTLLMGERNDLYLLLSCNYARIVGRKSNHVLAPQNLTKFESDYQGQLEWDGMLAYSLVLRSQPEKGFQWDEVNFLINKVDFAILRIELKRMANPNRKDIPPETLIDGKYFFRSDVTYRKIEGRYYPALIHMLTSDYDASNTVKVGGKVLKQTSEQLFLLTDLETSDASRIKNAETEDRDSDLYKVERPYNEVFWKTYNTVMLNPLKRQPDELQKRRSLDAQFKDTKKNHE